VNEHVNCRRIVLFSCNEYDDVYHAMVDWRRTCSYVQPIAFVTLGHLRHA